MKKLLVLILLWVCSLPAAEKPKLVIAIAADQFRYDYLMRFRSEYTGGLQQLLTKGAVMANANLEHYPTVTAIGHATYLSGAYPSFSGIIGNDWYDRESGKTITSVSDEKRQLVGATGAAASPHRLLVSTVGDELKMATGGAARVIGISLKDRSAILPVGRRADGAYWFDNASGHFVTSTWYMQTLPRWVETFNEEEHWRKYANKVWAKTRKLPEAGPKLASAVYNSPFGNELLQMFAEQALRNEKLGQRDTTDLLAISFSSNDAVGHAYGPEAPEVREVTLETDRVLGQLFKTVDKLVGMQNVLVIFTTDHGVAPVPEKLVEAKMPGGRTTTAAVYGKLQGELEKRFGPGNWILATAGSSPYLNHALMKERKLDPAQVRQFVADILYETPLVLRVYTREQLLAGSVPTDRFSQRVLRGYNPRRSGDVEVLLEPYWIRGATVATHGTPYSYDAHIPLIFMGRGIRPGRYHQEVALNDVAPTLSSILEVEIPSGSSGRVLDEILVGQ